MRRTVCHTCGMPMDRHEAEMSGFTCSDCRIFWSQGGASIAGGSIAHGQPMEESTTDTIEDLP